MTKQEFLKRLQDGLSGLPQSDIEDQLRFYSEMIDDRIEDGLSEEESVRLTGDPQEIAQRIIRETPISRLVKEKVRNRAPLGTLAIVLLVLGFPLWFPMVITFFAVLFSIFVAMWATNFALAVSAPALLFGSISLFIKGNITQGFLAIGGAMVTAGLAILLFFAFKAITKAVALLIRRIIIGKDN